MKTILSVLTLVAACGAATSATAQITFSPAAGTYSGSQSVSISCNPSSTTTIWYTTNGYPANTAATKYTGPIEVSGTTTIHAICATTGGTNGYDAEVNPQESNNNWKCNVPNPPMKSQNGDFDCTQSGGVSGSLSSWNFSAGSPAYLVATTTATNETNALLFIHTPTTPCDTCTTITQNLSVEPSEGATAIIRNEMDMEQCCDTTTNALRQASLQCNGSVWEIDASGSWEPTTIACNLPTNAQTDVVYEAQWVNGDTGCGGSGCMYLNGLTINGTRYFPLSQYCNSGYLNCAKEGMISEAGWTHWGAGNQHQLGLNGTSGCGQGSSCTGGRYIYTNNVTATQGTVGTASATYTIEATTAPTPVIAMPTGTYVGQYDTISDALSGATIHWCYTGVGTCTPNMTYTGQFWVNPTNPTTETVCAYATATGYSQSDTTCAYYVGASTATVAPAITLASGTYAMPTSTTITDSATGAAILWCYVASGTCTPSAIYTSSIYINPTSTETICATAWAPADGQSSPVCHTYTNSK